MADGGIVYIYDASNNLLSSPAGAARIEFTGGNLVVRSGEGAVLASQSLAEVDYFALADNGIHNSSDALTSLATASGVRIADCGTTLRVSASSAIEAVEAYGADGKLLGKASGSGCECSLKVAATGPIVVKVCTADRVTRIKLIKK